MANRSGTFKWKSGAQREVRRGVGMGVVNLLLYAEERAKADAPVRGGHRSFATGSHLGGPLGIEDMGGIVRGKSRVGGTFRRSIYFRCTVDGVELPGTRVTDENRERTPPPTGHGSIVGSLGTNCGYGLWVDQGTSRMPARPTILPALRQALNNAGSLMRAGASRYFGGKS